MKISVSDFRRNLKDYLQQANSEPLEIYNGRTHIATVYGERAEDMKKLSDIERKLFYKKTGYIDEDEDDDD